MSTPRILVIVLNYKHPMDTIECVQSVIDGGYPQMELLIIDNDSKDDSVVRLREAFPSIHLIQNEQNLGYAGGNNVGIRFAVQADFEFALVLNNDVVIHPRAIYELAKASQSYPQAALFSSKIYDYKNRQIIDSLGTSLDWLKLRPKVSWNGQIDTGQMRGAPRQMILPGSVLMLRLSALKNIGLFDERFFMIHEDADLCLRSLHGNFENRVVTDAIVYHKRSKTLSKYPYLTQYYSVRNFLFLAKLRARLWEQIQCGLGVILFSIYYGIHRF